MAEKDSNDDVPRKGYKSWSIFRVRQIQELRELTLGICLLPAPLGIVLIPFATRSNGVLCQLASTYSHEFWHWHKFSYPEHGCRPLVSTTFLRIISGFNFELQICVCLPQKRLIMQSKYANSDRNFFDYVRSPNQVVGFWADLGRQIFESKNIGMLSKF